MSTGHFVEEPLGNSEEKTLLFHATAEQVRRGDPSMLNISNLGYQYGEGVFETLRTCNGQPVLLSRHLERLAASARSLGIPLPPDLSAVPEALENSLPKNKGDVIIKIILSRGGSGRYDEPDSHALLSLQILPLNPPPEKCYCEGVALITFGGAQRHVHHPPSQDAQLP